MRPPRKPGAPRRYRLPCPVCSRSCVPRQLGEHLMIGACEAKRDYKPWLEYLRKLKEDQREMRLRLESAANEKERLEFGSCLSLMETQRQKVIEFGPEGFEWADD